MAPTKTDSYFRRQAHTLGLFPLLKKINNLPISRMFHDTRDCGIVGPGFNVMWETERSQVLKLIEKLRPRDCGKKLIRIGAKGDGGYLVPDDLDGIEYCFSPGVNTISEFENQLADRNIKSFLADFSVESPPIMRPEFTFDKKFLGATDNERFFTLASWKEKYLKGYAGDLILQMDIEGGEYPVILNTSDELLNQFRILVIEFHALDRLFDPFIFGLYSTCFEKLLTSFYVAHIHPNNFYGSVKRGNIEIPRLMEFTFLNKKRVRSSTPAQSFPHALDEVNVPSRRDVCLPRCWYDANGI